METRKYPTLVQIFLFEDGEINAHPVFEEWEYMDDHYFELPPEAKLSFDDKMDLIVKHNRNKLESLEKDELGRRILLVKGIEKYFK